VAIATAAGLDRAAAGAWLDDSSKRDTAAAEDQRAREIGVEGVPFFIFNGRLAVSGAHPAETLFEAMKQADAPPGE
jgi:predicted DsbA family dithiol-disulfide isomerase